MTYEAQIVRLCEHPENRRKIVACYALAIVEEGGTANWVKLNICIAKRFGLRGLDRIKGAARRSVDSARRKENPDGPEMREYRQRRRGLLFEYALLAVIFTILLQVPRIFGLW